MERSNQKLEKFITKILQLQNQEKSPVLKVDDLKSIALEMGLGEEGWKQISDNFNAHALRGKGFLDYKNWTDAIAEFEQANTLNPYNTDVLYGLAIAHQNLWNETQKKDYKQEAEKYAKNCIAIDPTYKEAIRLISELKRPKSRTNNSIKQTSTPSKNSNKKLIWIIVLAFIVLAIFLFLFVQVNEPSKKTTNTDYREPAKIMTTTSESSQTQELNENENPIETEEPIKVYLVNDSQSKGLEFELHKVKLNDYKSSYSVEVKGYFKLRGIEIEELKIKVDVLNENGGIIYTKIKNLVDDSDSPVRSGDEIPLDFSNYEKDTKAPKIKAIRLSTNFIVKESGKFNYTESKIIPVSWAIDKPANFDIRVRERVNTKSEQFNGGMYQKLVLEVENSGNSTINLLQLQLKWYDKQNNVAQTEEFYVCIDSHPPIKRGKVRIYDRMFGIDKLKPQDYKNYTVTVLQVN